MNPENVSENSQSFDKIPYTIDIWKSKLIDLSKRNRALNFKTNKISTVTIAGDNIPEIFKYLCIDEKALKFLAKPENTKAHKENTDDEESTLFDGENFELAEEPAPKQNISSLNFESYEIKTASHSLKQGLLTNTTKDNLDKSLRRIEQRARLSIDEQGVNALFLALGMLRYSESDASDIYYKAPLILIPVELSRRSARTGYTISASDDEVIVNPSLAEYLKQQYGLTLPGIPNSDEITEDYNLGEFFNQTASIIKSMPNWSIVEEIQLGLFSFQKLVMYKDLETNAHKLADHPLIRSIILREEDSDFGLPADIRELNLDEEFPPETQRQIMDADSSQMRAIAAVARNKDLVLVGPPGTGKSQTITNLIANALSNGKKVLFVSEKMAALDVVHQRLRDTGVGEFCLELHSTKVNKRKVMDDLRRTIDDSLLNVRNSNEASSRLPEVRRHLNEYVDAVHKPFGTLGESPFKIFGELEKVRAAPKVSLQKDILTYTNESVDSAFRSANDLSIVAKEVGDPLRHPFCGSKKDYFSSSDIEKIKLVATDLIVRIDEALGLIETIESVFGMPSIDTFSDIEMASNIASVISSSPGAPVHVLESDDWNTPPEGVSKLVKAVKELQGLRKNLETKFNASVFEDDPEEDILYIREKLSGSFGFLAFFSGRFRSVRRKWNSFQLETYDEKLIDQADDMSLVCDYLKRKSELEGKRKEGESYFGDCWKGEASKPSNLEAYITWVTTFRKLVIDHGLQDQSFVLASEQSPDITDVENLAAKADEIILELSELSESIEFDPDYLEHMPISTIKTRLLEIVENLNLAPKWAAFETKRNEVENSAIGELLPIAMKGEIDFDDLGRAFKKAFYSQWLDTVIRERSALRSFNSLTHEERILEFRKMDKAVLAENRAGLVNDLRNSLQEKMQSEDVKSAMPYLRKQWNRQRGIPPLRITFKHSLKAIQTIKPCFLMSPLTVAQLLDGDNEKFDLVIFDEASQVPTEDAIGAILRAEQLVVVGDPKQLPPTNFFAVQTGQVNADEVDEDGLPIFEDSESILEEVSGAGVPKTSLKWHYRSEHESLITFSNANFYDFELYTFPSVESMTEEIGLHFEYVENGVYEGRGLNMIEARRVADEVVRHIKQKPELSLGVGTFNMRQQIAIQDELEVRRRDDPSIEEFFDNSKSEPFFVKNLENIQGDERDVIFLSVTYGKEADGRMRYRLGPINGENGWRRLNVLTTRAKHQMKVFSSVRSDEINLSATASNGARLLKSFLHYAEHGIIENEQIRTQAEAESPFEREVLRELQNRNYSLEPQVGVCGYRIDIGVLDENRRGRYLCGIECDGVSYHSSETARDRDRTRQQMLEARGWDIHRIWSTDWFKDRDGQIERLVKLIERSKDNWRSRDNNAKLALDTRPELESELPFEAVIIDEELESLEDSATQAGYVRPVVKDYELTPDDTVYGYELLLEADVIEIRDAISRVVLKEGPLHFSDLAARVAGFWGQNTGQIIIRRIRTALEALAHDKLVILKGDFVWGPHGAMLVRSREGTSIPIERIAPEEIREAVALILTSGAELSRIHLINEVRSILGYARTGPNIKVVVENAIDELIKEGRIGESSFGLALRRS